MQEINQKDSDIRQKEQKQIPAPQATHKRVVKIPLPQILRKKVKLNDETQLWKPKTLQSYKNQKKESKQASNKFKLLDLPKPVNNQPINVSHHHKKILPKPILNIQNPTEEQIKWDIQDQSFIVKQFQKPNPNPNLKQHFAEQNYDQQLQLPEDFKGHKITNIQKGQLLDADWKRKQQQKKTRLSLWNDALLPVSAIDKSKNQINMLLEEAMKRQVEDYEINKKANQKKMIKTRYGW